MEHQRITTVEEKLLQSHPDWSQDKAHWMALQVLGMVGSRR